MLVKTLCLVITEIKLIISSSKVVLWIGETGPSLAICLSLRLWMSRMSKNVWLLVISRTDSFELSQLSVRGLDKFEGESNSLCVPLDCAPHTGLVGGDS